jgi:hypothetical protein
MHGSSSVPEKEVRRINAADGKLDPSARGVDEEEYLPAARLGVTKINIDTDRRLLWTRGYTGNFSAITPNRSIFDRPAKPLWKNTRNLSPEERKTGFGRTVALSSSIFSEANIPLFPQSFCIKPSICHPFDRRPVAGCRSFSRNPESASKVMQRKHCSPSTHKCPWKQSKAR